MKWNKNYLPRPKYPLRTWWSRIYAFWLRLKIAGGWVPHPHLVDLEHRLNPWKDRPLQSPAEWNNFNYPTILGDAHTHIDWQQVEKDPRVALDALARARGIRIDE